MSLLSSIKGLDEVQRTTLVNQICEAIDSTPADEREFTLAMPVTLTVKKAQGFRRESFTGSETFLLKRAYVGKSGNLIFIFEPSEADRLMATYEWMEATTKVAVENLNGFAKWYARNIETVLRDYFDALENGIDPLEEEESTIKTSDHPDFGTW